MRRLIAPARSGGGGTGPRAAARGLTLAAALLAAAAWLGPPAAAQPAAAPPAPPLPRGQASPGDVPGPPPADAARDALRLADLAARLDAAEATLVVGDSAGSAGSAANLVLHPERAAERLPPCSTFKIPNSLIALTAGAVTRNNNRIAWDPERDPEQDWWPDRWAEDQDMPSALRRSAVWYYQELARRIGAERMQAQLDRIGYGNRDISGGIDRFWLDSSLAISADEQVEFLGRLVRGALGFRPEHESYVADALVMERGTQGGVPWRLVAKTGSCHVAAGSERWVGWLVGWIEGGGRLRPTVFAFNTRGASYAEIRDERSELALAALRELGALSAEAPAPAAPELAPEPATGPASRQP